MLSKIDIGPDYTCAMDTALSLSVMHHENGGTFIRLVSDTRPNDVRVFAIAAPDVDGIIKDLSRA